MKFHLQKSQRCSVVLLNLSGIRQRQSVFQCGHFNKVGTFFHGGGGSIGKQIDGLSSYPERQGTTRGGTRKNKSARETAGKTSQVSGEESKTKFETGRGLAKRVVVTS